VVYGRVSFGGEHCERDWIERYKKFCGRFLTAFFGGYRLNRPALEVYFEVEILRRMKRWRPDSKTALKPWISSMTPF
jgi:hypothetical protein